MASEEKRGFRDAYLEALHTLWGHASPLQSVSATLALEYDNKTTKAMVLYRRYTAPPLADASGLAIAITMANAAAVPLWSCTYDVTINRKTGQYGIYSPVALNDLAERDLDPELSERQWVDVLYRARKRHRPVELFKGEQLMNQGVPVSDPVTIVPAGCEIRACCPPDPISLRHRSWGGDCPMADVDLVVADYTTGRACAMIEYKHVFWPPCYSDANYVTFARLANRLGLPFYGCQYSAIDREPDRQLGVQYRVSRLNDLHNITPVHDGVWSEREYVSFLYGLRGTPVPPDLYRGDELMHRGRLVDRQQLYRVIGQSVAVRR